MRRGKPIGRPRFPMGEPIRPKEEGKPSRRAPTADETCTTHKQASSGRHGPQTRFGHRDTRIITAQRDDGGPRRHRARARKIQKGAPRQVETEPGTAPIVDQRREANLDTRAGNQAETDTMHSRTRDWPAIGAAPPLYAI